MGDFHFNTVITDLMSQIDVLMVSFVQNGYNPKWVHKLLFQPVQGPANKPQSGQVVVLPHTPYVSRLKRTLANNGAVVVHKSNTCMRGLYKLNNSAVNKLDCRNVVYKVQCADCNLQYIGETTRKLSTRLREHQLAANKGQVSHSALSQHLSVNKHTFHLEDVVILD